MLSVYEGQVEKFEKQIRNPDPEWKVTHELKVRNWSPMTDPYDDESFNKFLVFILESIANNAQPLFVPYAGQDRQLNDSEDRKSVFF